MVKWLMKVEGASLPLALSSSLASSSYSTEVLHLAIIALLLGKSWKHNYRFLKHISYFRSIITQWAGIGV